jgi:serine protease inhibitor
MFKKNTSSLNNFSFKLLIELCDNKNGNFFISPFSIMTVLSILFLGARNKTRLQLKTLLDIDDLTDQEILDITLYSINYLISSDFTITNSVFSDNKVELNSNFSSDLKEYFLANITKLNFKNNFESAFKINQLISEKTNYKINNIVNASYLSQNILMLLVSTIYFKTNWLKNFNESLTEKQNFYLLDGSIQEVSMMQKYDKFHLQINPEGLKASLCTIAYDIESLFMTIVLPDRNSDIFEVQKTIRFEHLVRNNKLPLINVDLCIPKFKINFNLEV